MARYIEMSNGQAMHTLTEGDIIVAVNRDYYYGNGAYGSTQPVRTARSTPPVDRRRALERQMLQASEELERLNSRPKEPEYDDNLIHFTLQYPSGEYTYAAVQTGGGLWYLTGGRACQGVTWDQLFDWIEDKVAGGSLKEMWRVSGYERLV